MKIYLGAKLSVLNNKEETPLDLIFKYVQNPGEFITKLFDRSIEKKFPDKDSEHIAKSFTFKYNILNPKSGKRRGAGNVSLKLNADNLAYD